MLMIPLPVMLISSYLIKASVANQVNVQFASLWLEAQNSKKVNCEMVNQVIIIPVCLEMVK